MKKKKDVFVEFVNTPACRNVEKKTEARAVVTPASAGDYARVPGVDAIGGPQGFSSAELSN